MSATSPLVTQTNLVGDGAVPAAQIDPALQAPDGIAFGATGIIWVADDAAGDATLYDGDSALATAAGGSHTITISPPPGSALSSPAGVAANPNPSGFDISAGGVTAPARFIFAAQNGTLSGWAPTVDGGAATVIASTMPGADYTGLAIGASDGGTDLFAADFTGGTIDEFDSTFQEVATFTDDTVPDGYAPFGVQVLGGSLFVSYALQTPTDPALPDPGAGAGFIDEFSLGGSFEGRVASAGGLDAPNGLAIAPASFGAFAGDLLVANSGSGAIDAYNLTTDAFQGELLGANGQPLVIGGLNALQVGAGGAGGSPDQLYFTAGQGGLVGTLSASLPAFANLPVSGSGGIVTADESSAALGAGLALGTVFDFGPGVQAVDLTDAVVSVGTGTSEAFVQRLYEGLLDRGNDTAGIEFYQGQLAAGVTAATVAGEFLSSAEFLSGHVILSGSALVALEYQGLLGRSAAADPASAFWTNLLASGVSAGAVTAGIAQSSESQAYLAPATSQVFVPSGPGTLIHELFETGLGREADPSGLQFFQAEAAGVTPMQIASQLASSSEFQADHAGQSPVQLLLSLYEDGLGRAPDPVGSAFWLGTLSAGASVASVLLGIATAPEATGHLTQNLTA